MEENENWWKKYWKEMPEFVQEDQTSYRKLIVHFRNEQDVEAFAELIGQKITPKQKSLWYPYMPPRIIADKAYKSKTPFNPKYPVYIISKGRWKSRLTVKALEAMNVPYHIVVEPDEYEQYSAVIDPKKIYVLPENFSSLDQGSIPARNWVWEHAISTGAKRHWILDDNIEQFNLLNHNLQIRVLDGTIFRIAEDFVDRYENVALAGFEYDFFLKSRYKWPPLRLNTRIYSCILIKNDLPYRWRGKYNEDTDLSLRVLKDGWCTVLFLMFIQQKAQTMTMRGGNTDSIYNTDDERWEFAKSLVEWHPDVAKIVRKFGRWHHQVDYSLFRNNKLIPKRELKLKDKPNNYGLIRLEGDEFRKKKAV